VNIKKKQYEKDRINIDNNIMENLLEIYSDKLISKVELIMKSKNNKRSSELIKKVFNVTNLSLIPKNELSHFVNSLLERIYLFDLNYPDTLIDLFDGLYLCENLRPEDKELLCSFRKFFKIDENNDNYEVSELLAIRNIDTNEGEKYLGSKELNNEFFEENLFKRLETAHINFIVTKLIIKESTKVIPSSSFFR